MSDVQRIIEALESVICDHRVLKASHGAAGRQLALEVLRDLYRATPPTQAQGYPEPDWQGAWDLVRVRYVDGAQPCGIRSCAYGVKAAMEQITGEKLN